MISIACPWCDAEAPVDLQQLQDIGTCSTCPECLTTVELVEIVEERPLLAA